MSRFGFGLFIHAVLRLTGRMSSAQSGQLLGVWLDRWFIGRCVNGPWSRHTMVTGVCWSTYRTCE
ncbi:hypothetical protein BIU91_17805 [Curtobacterium sp. MMLR14_002]|nr:hypothetical protein BIU91_17805 [Curtobacterium sp. MMLR14_002]